MRDILDIAAAVALFFMMGFVYYNVAVLAKKNRPLAHEVAAFKRVLWWARFRQTHRAPTSTSHELATRIVEEELATLVEQLGDIVLIYENDGCVEREVERILKAS